MTLRDSDITKQTIMYIKGHVGLDKIIEGNFSHHSYQSKVNKNPSVFSTINRARRHLQNAISSAAGYSCISSSFLEKLFYIPIIRASL